MTVKREHIEGADCWCNPVVVYVPPLACKHCGRAISDGDETRGWVHQFDGAVLGRCNPTESGLPYGYNAEPVGQPCIYPCLGCRHESDSPPSGGAS